MPFTSEFKDKYIAPDISTFTVASIPDISAVSSEQGSWLGNFILNALRDPAMDDMLRCAHFNFQRRAEAAFREYADARQRTLAHLASQNPDAVSDYFAAIGHWEAFLSQAYQAWCLLVREQRVQGRKFFRTGDGSMMQRLNLLYNRSKHAEKAITSHQLPPDGTLPVWLRNDGLHCTDGKLSFHDMAEILRELAVWADAIQDPPTMEEKIRAVYGGPVARVTSGTSA